MGRRVLEPRRKAENRRRRRKKKSHELRERPSIDLLIAECLSSRHVPSATYRLQLNSNFSFDDAKRLVPYLNALGASDVYLSPILQARPGSAHGYDVCDHSRVSEDLGGERALLNLAAALEDRNMGLVLDVVPNHMAVGNAANDWWADVLEHGASARHAEFFDIDWQPTNPDLKDKVLLPILGDQYGKTLEARQLQLSFGAGEFLIHYFDTTLPVTPRSYLRLLSPQIEDLTRRLGDDHDHLLEFRSILTALKHLPPHTGLKEERQAERYREVATIKRRLAALVEASTEVYSTLCAAVDRFNGRIGSSESFDELDALIAEQCYRPAFWRVAMDEVNYRRFFDVNELAAIRIENPRVFDATHDVIFRILARVSRCGLRIDHPDGLYNPARYFQNLQERYLLDQLQVRLGGAPLTAPISRKALAALADHLAGGKSSPLYVVAEKILGENEPLPHDWHVDGTTGYDFLNACNRLFIPDQSVAALERLYHELTAETRELGTLVRDCKQIIMHTTMASEIGTFSHQLDRIAERNRHYRDFTRSDLRHAIREFIASLVIYRTYTTPDAPVSDRDRHFIELACEHAKLVNQRVSESIFDFIRDTLLLSNLNQFPPGDRPHVLDWVLRFQQVTGPIMAKGIEDTAFYVYNRLISLNEVGGHPDRSDSPLLAFHDQSAEHAQNWPCTMLCSSTHDTKRSEDVRARLHVVSELVDDWARSVAQWFELTTNHLAQVDGKPAPTSADRYLLFQTSLGTWPDPAPASAQELGGYRERIVAFMDKAVKEAKQNSNWVNPNVDYDEAVRSFVGTLLSDRPDNAFLKSFAPFAQRVARLGRFNSLAQVVLKLTAPGVPDIYQGNEVWDFSLVDPDNRRQVCFESRARMLDSLRPLLDQPTENLDRQVADLLAQAIDGRIKLYVTSRLLRHRQSNPELFKFGSYVPLKPVGSKAECLCAFQRQHDERALIVATCIRPASVAPGETAPPVGETAWKDTFLPLPNFPSGMTLTELLTGRELPTTIGQEGEASLALSQVFATLPVAAIAASPS